MNKLKDFLYDKNDIIIAVLILAIAAVIIAWRMDVILQYPKELLGEQDVQTGTLEPTSQQPEEGGTSQQATSQENTSQSETVNPAQTSGNSSTETTDKPEDSTSTTSDLWINGQLSRDITVDVAGNSAAAAVNCLVESGLFKDYAEYKEVCLAAGLDDEKVSAGEFIFPQGYTKAQIAKKINWG